VAELIARITRRDQRTSSLLADLHGPCWTASSQLGRRHFAVLRHTAL